MGRVVRVATTQYRTGNDVQKNLERLLSLVAEAAAGGAKLVVGPEFGNHTSFYRDKDHAWEVSVTPEGEYVSAVRECAKKHSIYVCFNATRRGEPKPVAYITNFLVGPDGELVGYDDKQVLMGGEAEFLQGATQPGKVYETGIGRIGMMSCLDGVPPETARNLALRGAQIITNSHNSCALDEPYAHIPARAAENRAWVIAAGKVGAICVDEMLDPLADMVGIPKHLITALGENPILDTSGQVVARLPTLEEGVVFADIDVDVADDKSWRDGDLFKDRRPELYSLVASQEVDQPQQQAQPFNGAIVQMRSDRPVAINAERALDLIADAAANRARVVVLPELVIFDPEAIAADPGAAVQQSRDFEAAMAAQCKALRVYVAASLVTDDGGIRHSGILLDDQGERVGCYHQAHLRRSYRDWAIAGDELPVWDTPLGRIGMLVGYDMVFPEAAVVLGRKGADVVVHPTRWEFDWELDLILPERAAENRFSILSSARLDSVVERGGMICSLPSGSRALRARDLNPIWPVEAPRRREVHVSTLIDPMRSRDKDLIGFDLLKDRRPNLYKRLVA